MKQMSREYLLRVVYYVKLSYFIKELGLHKQNVSSFMHGDDSKMSVDDLAKLCNAIHEKIA